MSSPFNQIRDLMDQPRNNSQGEEAEYHEFAADYFFSGGAGWSQSY